MWCLCGAHTLWGRELSDCLHVIPSRDTNQGVGVGLQWSMKPLGETLESDCFDIVTSVIRSMCDYVAPFNPHNTIILGII